MEMGSPSEVEASGGGQNGPSSHTKATFSGTTAFIGVLSLLITIISTAVPHWGSYSPVGQQFFAAGKFLTKRQRPLYLAALWTFFLFTFEK